MAKNTKGGLGRGINSLLSGSAGEAIPAEEINVSRETVTFEPEKKPANERQAPKPAKKPIEQETKTSSKEEKPPRVKEASEEEILQSASVEEEASSNISEPQSKKKVFDDDDDHVVIKEVIEREIKKPKAKEDPVVQEETVVTGDEVPIDLVQPNPDQPRTNFKQEEIEELASSIERDGLLQPILVRPFGKGYQIIAGERRWQACKSIGIKTVPIRIRDVNDGEALELALIENIQRSDLNPIEEAYGYRRLMERGGLTQSEVAEVVSKGRSTIANALRLLELPEEAQQLLFEEKISAGHARAILSIPSKVGREKLTERMINEKISVREAEMLARLFSGVPKAEGVSVRIPTPKSFKNVARELRKVLNTNVKVKTVQGKNKIEIEFQDEEELERLFEKLSSERIDD